MSIPLYCPGCGEFVGVNDYLFAGFEPNSSIAEITCPGKGKHQPSVRTTKRTLFGLIEHVTVTHPDTLTSSSWNEYIGPKRPFFVWFAIVFGSERGVVINHKWCWWDAKLGFYGDGVKEFQSA